jgi:hypothetical protein
MVEMKKQLGGMPENAIKGMLQSQNVPEHLKKAWRKKLKKI